MIDFATGLIIDYEVLSKYCHACELQQTKFGSATEEFKRWYENHKKENKCAKNYDGLPTGMELVAGSILWKRSVTKSLLQYMTMLSDGDTKMYDYLCRENVYGDQYPIEKEECVNHVSKRMGTALRKLVTEKKKDGVRSTWWPWQTSEYRV